MRRHEISERQWEAIKDKLPCQPAYKGKRVDNRLFVNAVMYVAKCGIPWRDLPERFGTWNSVYVRFRRWAKTAMWQNIFEELPDKHLKALLIDSTAVRVHQHGAGALKNNTENSEQNSQATGRSRGGLTTKIHLCTDENGKIKRLVLTGGQTADVKLALDLMQGLKANKLIADKAYDADWLLYYLQGEDTEAVIPPRRSRLQQRTIDYKAYRQRNVIERTINKLKQYRRVATRYDKTAASFISLCYLAATFINFSL